VRCEISKFPHFQIAGADFQISTFPNFQIELFGLGTSDDPVCVYCRKVPAEPAWRPFCSERCKLADLGTWLTGGYAIPAAPGQDEDPDDDDPEHG
jgi:endogenous inhibitor of DNA gyrase (YacG/DUF329 family)